MAGMIVEWMRHHQTLVQLMGVVSLAMFFLTPLVLSFLIIRIPEDYFLHGRDYYREMSRRYHPAARFLFHVVKNLAGIAFLLAGVAMLVLPGQGIVTILVSLTLIDFPGKRALELRLVSLHKVLAAVNWVRARAGKPHLKIPGRP
jgi:hypothetical protein